MVAAEGEVDLGNVDQFRTAAIEAVRPNPARLIFDLRGVTYMDSSGLGVLIAARRLLGKSPDCVLVVTSQPALLRSLQITGLDQVLNVAKDMPATLVAAPN